ncbi:hypothetical protein [Petroclostridium xylanilyticum]|uniref:hypothetical protein n=1 Tax=Petroclostridium xylanilyticum TaxID=1792311 RepID=UPI0012FF7AC7|nr:hypothetical protein [Petroclostridium xylanilyticum]
MRAIHLGFVLLLAFLLYPAIKSMSRREMHWMDVVLGVLGAGVASYIVWNYRALIDSWLKHWGCHILKLQKLL